MIPISDKMKSYLDSPIRQEGQYVRCVITGRDGKVYNVNDADFVSGSLQINRKSVSSSSFDIGECYINDVKFSIIDSVGISEVNLNGGTVSLHYGVVNQSLDLDEEFQIGKFIIPTDVTRRRTILDITGDSVLSLFYRSVGGVSTQGFLYNLVRWCCDMCGVEFALDETTFNALSPNTALMYYISDDSSIESYLDVIMYVSQLIGGFATDTNDGKLTFKVYTQEQESIQINNDVIASSKIGSNYISIDSITMKFDDETILVSDGDVTDYLLELDSNPLLDKLTSDLRHTVLQNLFGVLNKVRLRSFSFGYNGNPALECGDKIAVTERDLVSYVSDVSWGYHKKCTIQGVSLDKRTKTKSQAIKQASTSGGGGSSGKLDIIKFINSKGHEISGVVANVATMYFILPAGTSPLINTTIVCNARVDCTVRVEVTYDNVVQLLVPRFTVKAGYNTLSFSHSCDSVDVEMQHILRLGVASTEVVDIAEYDIECNVVGWNIQSSLPVWSGIYELADDVASLSVDSSDIAVGDFKVDIQSSFE